jgi:tripartite ATP-independent transporter DctP family solute receptor
VVYGSSQLGGDELMLQKIKLGTLEFALPSTVMSSQIDEFGLFEMPYLVRDREHMRAIEDEVVWSDLAPLAEEEGYHMVAVWENGFRHVTNSARPIESPADLAGVKLRTPRGVWRVKLFQALGANPTPMALSEVFIALQTGVIDGQENPLAQIWGSKLYEVQEYLSLTGHVYTPGYVVASPAFWDGLPDDVRVILEEEARGTRPDPTDWRGGQHSRSRGVRELQQVDLRRVRRERARWLDLGGTRDRRGVALITEDV